MKRFKKICRKTQKQLIPYLFECLKFGGYTEVIKQDGFIYAKGDIPILLTAHMDTVHDKPVQTIFERTVQGKTQLFSPQGIGGDDRCGIYMILEIIKTHKCSVLFCEDEEIGCVGSTKFCNSEYINELTEMKYLIELDRANANDAVFYSCDNPEFTNFITENTGYKKAYGSFSDISHIAPKCKVAAVNLSCGYHNPHMKGEYVVIEEMLNTIQVVKDLLEVECEQFEYIEKKYQSNYYGYGSYSSDYYGALNRCYNNTGDMVLIVKYLKEGKLEKDWIIASSRYEAFGKFFLRNTDVKFNDIIDYEFDYT